MNENLIEQRKQAAAKHGIEVDQHGFPIPASLNEWHAKHNPKPEQEAHFPLWLIPLLPIVVFILIALK